MENCVLDLADIQNFLWKHLSSAFKDRICIFCFKEKIWWWTLLQKQRNAKKRNGPAIHCVQCSLVFVLEICGGKWVEPLCSGLSRLYATIKIARAVLQRADECLSFENNFRTLEWLSEDNLTAVNRIPLGEFYVGWSRNWKRWLIHFSIKKS